MLKFRMRKAPAERCQNQKNSTEVLLFWETESYALLKCQINRSKWLEHGLWEKEVW